MPGQYILPCTKCGQEHEISISQAGSEIKCQCGKKIDVPTMGNIKKLKASNSESPLKRVWGIRQAVLFLGLAVLLGGLITTGILYIFRPTFPYDALKKYADAQIQYRQKNMDKFTRDQYENFWQHVKVCNKIIQSGDNYLPTYKYANRHYPVHYHKKVLESSFKTQQEEYNKYFWVTGIISAIGALVCLGSLGIPSQNKTS